MIDEEVWITVSGFEGVYSVSSFGRVKRDQVGKGTKGGVLIPNRRTGGYLDYKLHKDGIGKTIKAHRLVARVFLGEPPEEKPEVNHIDGNKVNNKLSNLEYVARSGQMKHAYDTGLCKSNFRSKLTPDDVIKIRKRASEGESTRDLASEYNVSNLTISRCVSRKHIWKNVGA